MFIQQARQCLSSGRQAVQRHPKRLSAALLVALGGFGVTAFGIAPMAPDATDLPKRLVIEEIQPEGLAGQLEALAQHDWSLYRSTLSRNSDTIDSLLLRLGVTDAQAAGFIRQDPLGRLLGAGQAGKMVQARTAGDGSLLELVARFPALDAALARSHFSRLTVLRQEGQLISRLDTAALQTQARLGSGKVRNTLWAATEAARLPEAVAAQMIDIFSGDIDFHRQLQRGDSFSVLFESLTADDQPISWQDGIGRVLAAEYVNRGRSFQAFWHSDANSGKGAYFTPDGKNRRRAFLASPLEFSRITSGFAMRMHPLLHTWRAHNGVDYSAPTGTPVKTVGDGVVAFAGRQGGYGNVVEVKHPGNKVTLYAHLSRIDVKEGQRLDQGQVLGAVGATGWATGPHLHFEFKVNGQLKDPQEVAEATETVKIHSADRQRFQQWTAVARHKLAAAESLTRFRGDAE